MNPLKLPRFSLRELFLLVVMAAMGCGWWFAIEQYQAHWVKRWVESETKAQAAIADAALARSNMSRLEQEIVSLKQQLEWLQTPEENRPKPYPNAIP